MSPLRRCTFSRASHAISENSLGCAARADYDSCMLSRILHAFQAPKPGPLPEPDEKLALGALMVRVAKSDRHYDLAEIKRIDRLLTRLYGLKPIEAAKMRATCEKLEHAAPDTDRFGHLIRETVSLEARVAALEALWEVVLSDGDSQPQELQVLDAAREAMGLSHADSDTARAQAEAQ
ncbi:Tellurite resistance protein TerB [Roseovarius tolerans]|uniref:Tellurite resistance protein TerB n=2 Tax=Roseovarius tolerans TaxID=74031 RepID=A0A0L6CTQ6_9RHOB|nr:Tellurite resistance protein TerB [Roseovarius tolerans]